MLKLPGTFTTATLLALVAYFVSPFLLSEEAWLTRVSGELGGD